MWLFCCCLLVCCCLLLSRRGHIHAWWCEALNDAMEVQSFCGLVQIVHRATHGKIVVSKVWGISSGLLPMENDMSHERDSTKPTLITHWHRTAAARSANKYYYYSTTKYTYEWRNPKTSPTKMVNIIVNTALLMDQKGTYKQPYDYPRPINLLQNVQRKQGKKPRADQDSVDLFRRMFGTPATSTGTRTRAKQKEWCNKHEVT